MGNFLLRLFMAICIAITFVMTVITIYIVGPALEKAYFPVVSKLTINHVEANEDGNAVIMAEFTKMRNCEWLGLAWFKGRADGSFERVGVVLQRQKEDTSSPNRPLGTQRAGPWIISMPPDELMKNSFARLTHKCHGLWISETDFWP